MRGISTVTLVVALALGLGNAAIAQDNGMTAPKCPEQAAPLPNELATWTQQTPIMAAARSDEIEKATIAVGHAVLAEMKETPAVTYSARPANPGGKVSKGGIFKLVIGQAGTYRVAISDHAWIDVVSGDKSVESSKHGPGPACSGIRKMVDYPLEAGTYTLQLSASDQDKLAILVVPAF